LSIEDLECVTFGRDETLDENEDELPIIGFTFGKIYRNSYNYIFIIIFYVFCFQW